MKTAKDPRHQKRIQIMQELFSWNFSDKNYLKNDKSRKIIESIDEIDKKIQLAASSWPIDKINKIDLSILRLAVFELIIDKQAPEKVVIDEAVELGKEYGSDSSASFINGVLGKLLEQTKGD